MRDFVRKQKSGKNLTHMKVIQQLLHKIDETSRHVTERRRKAAVPLADTVAVVSCYVCFVGTLCSFHL